MASRLCDYLTHYIIIIFIFIVIIIIIIHIVFILLCSWCSCILYYMFYLSIILTSLNSNWCTCICSPFLSYILHKCILLFFFGLRIFSTSGMGYNCRSFLLAGDMPLVCIIYALFSNFIYWTMIPTEYKRTILNLIVFY